MNENQSIPWKRITIEAVAIIASILIAFALDAWWAERQLDAEVSEDLAIVDYELTENIRLTRLAIDTMNEVIAANRTLVTDLKSQSESARVDVPSTVVFWAVFMNPTLDLSLGSTDAWIAAGRLGRIASPQLRQRLASVRGKVEDVVEEQRTARDIGIRNVYPLIQDGIGDIDAVNKLFAAGYHTRQGNPSTAVPEAGVLSFPNSTAIRFALQSRTIWYEASINEMLDFQTELSQIQELLRLEIGESGLRLFRLN